MNNLLGPNIFLEASESSWDKSAPGVIIKRIGSLGIVSHSTNFDILRAGGSNDGTPSAPEQNKATKILSGLNDCIINTFCHGLHNFYTNKNKKIFH